MSYISEYVNQNVCAFTPTNEEDIKLWGSQYLEAMGRSNIPFAMHFDRCSESSKIDFTEHPLCVGFTEQNNPKREYTERDKQACFNVVFQHKRNFQWALHLDMDEVLERLAVPKMAEYLPSCSADLLICRWVNVWEKPEQLRIGDPFGKSILGNPRAKLYNLQNGRRWKFDHDIIYGCKLMAPDGTCPSHYGTEENFELVFVHYGLMNHDLRVLHRDRWNRVYGKAVGQNPYELWNHLVETENDEHPLVPNPYI